MWETLFIFATGLLAGIVNTVAGGGSLITVPLLIFCGLPSTIANATNRIAILAQAVTVVATFVNKGTLRFNRYLLLAVPACVGSYFGAQLAIKINPEDFKRVFAGIVIVCALLIVKSPRFSAEPKKGRLRFAMALLMFLFIGVYGGFVQAGVGFLIMGTLITVLGLDFAATNSIKMFIVLCFTSVAVALFQNAQMIQWSIAAPLALGNMAGGFLGVHLTLRAPLKWIRLGLLAFAVAVALNLFTS